MLLLSHTPLGAILTLTQLLQQSQKVAKKEKTEIRRDHGIKVHYNFEKTLKNSLRVSGRGMSGNGKN